MASINNCYKPVEIVQNNITQPVINKSSTCGSIEQSNEEKVLQATYRFASKIREAIAKENPNKNISFSTPSILLALSMCLKGMNEVDKANFIRTVGLKGMAEEDIHTTVGCLTDLLTLDTKDAKCKISNALLTTKPLSPEFIKNIQQKYKGRVFYEKNGIDLANQANAYVEKNTEGMIDHIVDPDPDLATVILNAIYFKGKWEDAFDKADTCPEEFTSTTGDKHKVDMLHSHDHLPYYQEKGFKMIEKAYKSPEGQKVSFVAFLPDENQSIEKMEQGLTMELVKKCRQGARLQKVNLTLPKLDLDSSYENFKETLEKMGMSFDGGIEGQDVSQIIHKTKVKLDEEGTEAAAVTAVVCFKMSVMEIDPPKVFKADRPFAYLICIDDHILFQGSVRKL